ncbi:CBASS cGAMP synthase [Acinetobacter sp. V91_7]|uniref:CBASS cGAMP synthase n=1 Tax=unclassified Acinetobacter TaxID=196816 RepID=UPI00287C10E0|nr:MULTISPECIES: CBASS cGAMP synthase [unclassified Acinetobacter]MDS7935175.1 CBASS cGAMP synthase [Acinetobacter sp. V91_4B]MDS7964001.1 CBASS cGAMP synthase [Acinetobacter sp. V91_7]MDS8027106.1 CBASS cGAMP synthase [Acinetobacter sp. V91_13]
MQNTSTANLHLVYQNEENGYATKLLPPPKLVDKLKECQIKVRNKLEQVLEQEYGTKPKFRVQGSFAYGTCNIPAQPHKGQELDLDYGAYLPASVFTLNDEGKPNSSEEAKKYIQVVYDALTELAQENTGWSVDQKPSCIRISGVAPLAHMDVPLYAVPNDMFKDIQNQHQLVLDSAQKSDKSLQERFESTSYSMESYDFALNNEIFENESLIDLESIEMIHMAKEDGSWFPSDCEKVRNWFKKQCQKHPNAGRQLRYIARYLKGWRDQQWEEKGPTSIVLMIAAVKSYTYVQGRDDQALSIVTSNLDTILANDIYVEDMEDHETEDFNRANASQRLENAQAARQLHKNIMQALQQGVMSPSTSLAYLTASFGNRIPTDTSLVRNDHQNPEDSIPNILQTPSIRRDSSVKLKSQSSG